MLHKRKYRSAGVERWLALCRAERRSAVAVAQQPRQGGGDGLPGLALDEQPLPRGVHLKEDVPPSGVRRMSMAP